MSLEQAGGFFLMQRLIKFYSELVRRRVIRVAAGYVVVLWILSLGFAELFPIFGLENWAVRAFIFAGLVGLPAAVFVAWKYNLTAAGLVQDPMDFPAPPLTPGKIRSWCLRRQDETAPVPLMAYWQDEKQRREKRRFTEVILIGREGSNDISIVDQRVSRTHAVVWFEITGWHIRDLDSSNGSFLNGKRIEGSRRLPVVSELRMHPKGPAVRFETMQEDQTLLTLHGAAIGEPGDEP